MDRRNCTILANAYSDREFGPPGRRLALLARPFGHPHHPDEWDDRSTRNRINTEGIEEPDHIGLLLHFDSNTRQAYRGLRIPHFGDIAEIRAAR